MSTDQQIEQEILTKGLTAPRVTTADIETEIASESYFHAADGVRAASEGKPGASLLSEYVTYTSSPLSMITICVLILRNGHRIVGVNEGPVSNSNFDAALGRKLAREDAIEKIWPLLGFRLRDKLSMEGQYAAIDRIARVCHEVNRAYCQALGDNSQPAWEDAPEWQRASARMGVDLHTMGNFGPEASHISWMRQKQDEGWTYGPVKDPEAKQHPCMVPFAELPREQQAKNFIFRAVVHALRETAPAT